MDPLYNKQAPKKRKPMTSHSGAGEEDTTSSKYSEKPVPAFDWSNFKFPDWRLAEYHQPGYDIVAAYAARNATRKPYPSMPNMPRGMTYDEVELANKRTWAKLTGKTTSAAATTSPTD